jgi:DELLA protein
MKLAQLAASVNIEFDFRGVVALKLNEVKPWMLQVLPGEVVAVNSVLQLHRFLNSDGGPVLAIDEVLHSILGLKPKIVTVVEHEANHNVSGFLDRFTEALHYYSTMFDSLEACNLQPQSSEQLLAEMYLGQEICNIIACEGVARVERHENLEQWRQRIAKAGFRPLQLGSTALKQAKLLLSLFPGDGYRVEENNGCLTLGWHTRPLIAFSAWQCA